MVRRWYRLLVRRSRQNWRCFGAPLACFVMGCGTAEPQVPARQGGTTDADTTTMRHLISHVPSSHTRAVQKHRLDGEQILSLIFVLEPVDEAGLDTLLQALYNPSNPQYGQYITPATFAAAFHPTPAAVEATRTSLAAHGFVLDAQPHGLLWSARAASRTVEATLGVQMHVFEAADKRLYHAPNGPIQVPQTWPVRAVVGLFEPPPRRPHYRRAASQTSTAPRPHVAMQLQTAYNLPVSATGAGQALSLLELDGYLGADIAAYAQYRAISEVPRTNILVGGFSGLVQSASTQAEVTLDIELLNLMAPQAAQIRVYEAANGSTSFVTLLNEMANPSLGDKLLPTLISCSWGLAEDQESPAAMLTEDTLFKQMAAQGQSFFASSGDTGALADGSTIGVSDPASQPWVVSVGGTTLRVHSDGSYQNESTWAGSGGGISSVWPIPSWQTAALAVGSMGSNTMRNVPDVSLNADPNTGYTILLNGALQSGVGGTSCAAPLWTAYMGLVNARRAERGLGPVGYVNPLLYSINAGAAAYGRNFHDIADLSTNGHYPAVTGFDQATGWGSFNGAQLLDTLASGYARRTLVKPAWL